MSTISIKNLEEMFSEKEKATEINTGDIVLVKAGYEIKEKALGIAVKGETIGQAYYVDITLLVTGEVHRIPLIDTEKKRDVMYIGGVYKTIENKTVEILGVCDISINIDHIKRH